MIAVAQAEHGLWRNADGRIAVLGGIAATWASGNYMRRYFGVSESQAQASGLPAFRAKAGVRDVSARIVGRYRLHAHWTLLGVMRYGRLVGDAHDSPLVRQRGSANQFLSGVGLTYAF
ncbi:MAG: MipA/OmpV family protein [Alphaproteobacteria bacterium]|nr:MAG: MipA/OmpV family protein [Alphaproteobacteria bacterium]